MGVNGSNNIFTQQFSIADILASQEGGGQHQQKGSNSRNINSSHKQGSLSLSLINKNQVNTHSRIDFIQAK